MILDSRIPKHKNGSLPKALVKKYGEQTIRIKCGLTPVSIKKIVKGC